MDPEHATLEMEETACEHHEDSGTTPSITSGGCGDSGKSRWITPGRVGLLLAVFPYLFFLILVPLVGPYRFTLFNLPGFGIVFGSLLCAASLAGLIGSFFSFRAFVGSQASQFCVNRKEKILGIVGLCIFFVNFIFPMNMAFVTMAVRIAMNPPRLSSPQDYGDRNLNNLYYNFTEFAGKHPDNCFPALSHKSGKLMHDYAELPANVSPSCYIARNDPDFKRFYHDLEFLNDPEADVDDWSYFYLGYEIHSEAEMEAFAQMYRQAYSAGKWLEGDLAMASDASDNGAQVIPRMNIRVKAMPPDAKRPPLPGKRGADIPVCIERIENHHNKGGHVLFLDGHVEFMDYPGRWPMTEKTMALLNDLDRMGTKEGEQ